MPFSEAIAKLVDFHDCGSIRKSAASITECYKRGGTLKKQEELLAYLMVRMPATYAVLCRVFKEVAPGSILDLGAGPGTVWWAAKAVWGIDPQVTALEREAFFIDLAKQLGAQARFFHTNFLKEIAFEPYDWAVFSYSLCEISDGEIPALLAKCWKSVQKGVVIVEPGTPRGFQTVLAARTYLIEQGGKCLAPCPHSNVCPLKGSEWCHFSVRLERSYWHRMAKLATLGYEDEKFSYVIISKESSSSSSCRILHEPAKRSGHLQMELCTPTGPQTLTITRSQKELYKKAKKANWGDSWQA